MAKIFFWVSLTAIFYTFVGYPIIVYLLAKFRARQVEKAAITPTVSIVIACLNEEQNIAARLENLLACDYPAARFEILVVSDGSTDNTLNIVKRYAEKRVRVFHYDERQGKPTALNLGLANANGEIVVFTDARQSFEPDVIKELVANFADPQVGAATGAYLMSDKKGSSVGEGVGFYWQYEELIRKSEARFGSVIGATGAIYAIRKTLWQPLPTETILDDVYTPMRIAMQGYRVVFEDKALAHDVAAKSAAKEFARKVRTLMGNYQLCQLMPRLLWPTNGLLLQFFSHKLLRLAAPIFMIILLAANLLLAMRETTTAAAIFYQSSLAGQLVFYASVFFGWLLSKSSRKVRLFNVAYVFSVMNAAALVGLFYFVLGKRNVWVRGE
ncbi:MAG: glycosyltransferase family 2 protein [Acidobacteria bacterium]|nr:glycosyltransferase family 2 protein [Acidobacteriota bacterium]